LELVPLVIFPVKLSTPFEDTVIPVAPADPLIDRMFPVQLSVPAVENVTALQVVASEKKIFAATLADDPTPRLGVVMQLVTVAP
jgi:hypothetical protein